MSEARDERRAPTPWHLWLVGILAVVWNVMGCFDFIMTQTRNEAYMANFTPEQLDFFFYGFPTWLIAFWAVAVWGGLLGAVLLLLRKKLAARVLRISFGSMIVTTIHNFGFANGLEIMGTFGAVFSAVIFIIAALLALYAHFMRKRKVLVRAAPPQRRRRRSGEVRLGRRGRRTTVGDISCRYCGPLSIVHRLEACAT